MQITAGDKIRKLICLGILSQESYGNKYKVPCLRARVSWLMLYFRELEHLYKRTLYIFYSQRGILLNN
jgi:hypothetical protein